MFKSQKGVIYGLFPFSFVHKAKFCLILPYLYDTFTEEGKCEKMSEEYKAKCPWYFKAYKRSLSRGQSVLPSVARVIPDAYKNPANIMIFCHSCECYMIYHNDPGTQLDGYYECPKCGKHIREKTPYCQLHRDDLGDDERERRRQEKRDWENDNDWD